MTNVRHILTSKISKLFFEIVLKIFSWVWWWHCGYSKHPLILSLSNDNKNIGIRCVYQNIFQKVDSSRDPLVKSLDVTLIASGAIYGIFFAQKRKISNRICKSEWMKAKMLYQFILRLIIHTVCITKADEV